MLISVNSLFFLARMLRLEFCSRFSHHIKRSSRVTTVRVSVCYGQNSWQVVYRVVQAGTRFPNLPCTPSSPFSFSSATLSSLLTPSFCCPFSFCVPLFISSQSATMTKGPGGRCGAETRIRKRQTKEAGARRVYGTPPSVPPAHHPRVPRSSPPPPPSPASSGQWTSGAL